MTGTASAEHSDSPPAAPPPGRGLATGSLRLGRTIAMSVGIQGPTAGVIIGPAIIAGIVGRPGALAQVLGLVAMAFVAYAFVMFTRTFNSASSVYAFNGTAVGPRYGLVSAWLMLLVYTSFAAGVYASTADIAQVLAAGFGLHAPWMVFALVGAALSGWLAYRSISLSSIVILVCEAAAILLVLVVGVVVLAKGGYAHHGVSTAAFSPHGAQPSVLVLGVVAVFGQFSGFEGAATLGDEARHSTRTVPVAIAGSLLLSAAVYIFVTWSVYAAYPSPAAVAADPAPLVHVASRYLSPALGTAVNAAGVISAFGAQLACVNAASRLLYALTRDLGGSDHPLARTSRRHRSPVGALAVVGPVSVLALLGFGAEPTAARAATLLIQYGSYLIIVGYLLTVVAAVVWVWRHRRSPIPLAVLTTGVLVLGYIVFATFDPLPDPPFAQIALVALLSLVAGVVAASVPRVRRRLGGSPLLNVTGTADGGQRVI